MNTRDASSHVATRTRPPSCRGSHLDPEREVILELAAATTRAEVAAVAAAAKLCYIIVTTYKLSSFLLLKARVWFLSS